MPTISTPGCRLVATLFLLALVGCTDSSATVDTLPRKAVTGTVTFGGQPLERGTIQFEPVERTQGTTLASGNVTDGKYSIDRAMGLVPGKYKVSISSRAAIKINPGEPPGPLPRPEPEKIPAQYNTRSTLTKEVSDESVNTLDFDLKGQ